MPKVDFTKLSDSEEYLLVWAYNVGFFEWFMGSYMYGVDKDANHKSEIKQLVDAVKVLHKLFGPPDIDSAKVYRFVTSHKAFTTGSSIRISHAYALASWTYSHEGLLSFLSTAALSIKRYAYVLTASSRSIVPMFTAKYLVGCLKKIPSTINIKTRSGFVLQMRNFYKQHEVVLLTTKPLRVTAESLPENATRNYSAIKDGVRRLVKRHS
jgi:hypothetical protein